MAYRVSPEQQGNSQRASLTLWSIHNNHYYGLSKIKLGIISFPLISWMYFSGSSSLSLIVMNIVCKNLPVTACAYGIMVVRLGFQVIIMLFSVSFIQEYSKMRKDGSTNIVILR